MLAWLIRVGPVALVPWIRVGPGQLSRLRAGPTAHAELALTAD
jgi:hypothetical protein